MSKTIFPPDVSFLWLTLQNERDDVSDATRNYHASMLARRMFAFSAIGRNVRRDARLHAKFPLYDATYATALRYKNALIDSYVLYSRSVERLARIVAKREEVEATLRQVQEAVRSLDDVKDTCAEM